MGNWKAIPGYEGIYEISNMGEVKSLDRINNKNQKVFSRIMSPTKLPKGYLTVMLSNGAVKRRFLIHRLVMQAFVGELACSTVDHINGIKNDNRLCNLRYCSMRENSSFDNINRKKPKTSKYVGVQFKSGRWYASIRISGKVFGIGYFDDETVAAKAYDAKVTEVHGEFANLNFK